MQEEHKLGDLIKLVFKALGLALGVSVVVLSVLGVVSLSTQVTLVAVGLACLAIASL